MLEELCYSGWSVQTLFMLRILDRKTGIAQKYLTWQPASTFMTFFWSLIFWQNSSLKGDVEMDRECGETGEKNPVKQHLIHFHLLSFWTRDVVSGGTPLAFYLEPFSLWITHKICQEQQVYVPVIWVATALACLWVTVSLLAKEWLCALLILTVCFWSRNKKNLHGFSRATGSPFYLFKMQKMNAYSLMALHSRFFLIIFFNLSKLLSPLK